VLLGWDDDRQAFARAVRMSGVPLRVIAVCDTAVAEPPPWLIVIEPGKVAEGLALCRNWCS
jgi:hypothetical protein